MRELRLNFGALTDLVQACQWIDPAQEPDEDERSSRAATMRAIATIIGGGYQCGHYKVVFFRLDQLTNACTPTPEIVRELLDTWGKAA
jgi:hypothetical protein